MMPSAASRNPSPHSAQVVRPAVHLLPNCLIVLCVARNMCQPDNLTCPLPTPEFHPPPCLLSHQELKPPDSLRLRRIGRPCHQADHPSQLSYTPLPVRLLPAAGSRCRLHAPVWSPPLLH